MYLVTLTKEIREYGFELQYEKANKDSFNFNMNLNFESMSTFSSF